MAIPELTNHLWQSTWFIVAAALAALAFRKSRAGIRYWLWFSASMKFLLPFALLVSAGSRVDWAPARQVVRPAVSVAIVEISQPFESFAATPGRAPRGFAWELVLPGVWACGFAAVVLIRLRGWRRIRALLRASTPTSLGGAAEVRSAPGLLEPGVVGWWRPVLLLPAGIAERLSPRQLEAVLAHELCHVRRRDNLTSALHMLVEAVFWFHPLVWWIGARLVEERERACDEEVLRLGGEPRDYAQAILEVCRLYVESPLVCVSGVTGADLKKRIVAILAGEIAVELTAARRAGLAIAGVAVIAAPVVVGFLKAPLMRAQPAVAGFEVAAIKPCKASEPYGAGGKKAGGGGPNASPGSLTTGCETIANLIRSAYVNYAQGYLSRDPSNPPVEGGPAWIRSDRYQVNAKTSTGSPDAGTMNGPMMRALLEDRLHLKVRRETREVLVYALTVAQGGPKLTPFQEGSCIPIDLDRVVRPRPENSCSLVLTPKGGPNLWLEGPAMTIGDIVKMLYYVVDRPVIDRTGIRGRFNIRVEFAPPETPSVFSDIGPGLPPRTEEPTAPSIFAVLEKQLGLKLEPAKGPREFVVIDHVERPSAN